MEYEVIVIGSGPGGYVAALKCAQLGLKTACIEKYAALGGTCLNVGCIPSKTLLHASHFYEKLGLHAEDLGVKLDGIKADFPSMMKRKKSVIENFNKGIGFLFKKNKVDHFEGVASFVSPGEISVAGKVLKAKHTIIATGSKPIELPFLPFDEKRILSSTGALSLTEVPKKMVVVGSGVIGVELGSVYRRLGSEVVFVELMDRICPTLDKEISLEFRKTLESQGLKFLTETKVLSGKVLSDGVEITTDKAGVLKADVALICVGRRSYTEGLNIESIGIKTDKAGRILTNASFETNVKGIYAIGDVREGAMLAHKASEEGVALAEKLAGHKAVIEEILIPNVIYTHPEVATVGLSREEAAKLGIEVKIGKFSMNANSRAKCSGEEEGFIRVLADKKTDKIVGVQIIGAHASEIIAAGVIAMKNRMTAKELGDMPFAHPTLSEALKESSLGVNGKMLHQ